jgi:hypothetical protein
MHRFLGSVPRVTPPASRRALSVIALAAVALGGCGGGSDKKSSPSVKKSDVASKSPTQLLSDVEQALGRVKSFHVEGTGVDRKAGPQKLSGDFGVPGKLHLSLTGKTGAIEFTVIDKAAYMKADRKFWQSQGLPAKALDLLADKWVKVPQSAAGSIGEFTAWTDPATIGHCLVWKDIWTDTSGGSTTFDGKPVVVLVDKGDKPGSSPGKLYVAASGDSLPLRAMQTGASQPGGAPDARCGETKTSQDSTVKSDLTLSRYNEPVTIAAPPNAVDLNALQAQAQGQSQS